MEVRLSNSRAFSPVTSLSLNIGNSLRLPADYYINEGKCCKPKAIIFKTFCSYIYFCSKIKESVNVSMKAMAGRNVWDKTVQKRSGIRA